MKISRYYKDASGFHFEVTLDETDPNSPVKFFNYGPEPDDDGTKEAQIIDEVKVTAAQLCEAWLATDKAVKAAAHKPGTHEWIKALTLDPPEEITIDDPIFDSKLVLAQAQAAKAMVTP